ncbi:MAG: patatin-like phospholipase family protein [Gammaproteobacteria bacterium]
MSQEKITILSLDGGGVRGAISCAFLKKLETKLGKSLFDSFDLFSGTSTGGLIAMNVAAAQATAAQCLKTYAPETSRRIFDASIFDDILPMQNQPKFDGDGKREVLQELFGERRLSDAKKPLLVTAYDVVNRRAVVFKSTGGSDGKNNPSLIEIGDATSAAPTYFPTVETADHPARWLVDGGLAANDPSMCALSEAIRLGYKLENIRMLSIGTGVPTRNAYRPEKLGRASQDWGGIGWLSNGLIDHLFAGNTSMAAYHCRQLLGDRFIKINGPLDGVSDDLDATSQGNYDAMVRLGNRWFRRNADQVLALLED